MTAPADVVVLHFAHDAPRPAAHLLLDLRTHLLPHHARHPDPLAVPGARALAAALGATVAALRTALPPGAAPAPAPVTVAIGTHTGDRGRARAATYAAALARHLRTRGLVVAVHRYPGPHYRPEPK
jgi:hypothetical protein